MGRAKCKKKAMERAKWALFFACVSLCVDLHTPLLLKQWSGQHDVSNTQVFYMPTQNTTDAWLTSICLVRCEKKKRKAPIKKMEVHINQLCSQGQLTDAVGIDPAFLKKKENESCIFLVVFYLQLYFEVVFFLIYVVFLIPVKAHSLYLVPRLQWLSLPH